MHFIRPARALFAFLLLISLFTACGGSPARFDPGTPGTPGSLSTQAGDGQVALSWAPATGAAAYNIYLATVSGLGTSGGAPIATVPSTTHTVTGLVNGISYFFVVTAVNSSGESAASTEATATPEISGPFRQVNLAGTWRFSILVSGVAAGWMRGSADIGEDGSVSVTSYLDSAGTIAPPAGLFTNLIINPNGEVRQDAFGPERFHGVLSSDLSLLVALSSPDPANSLLFVMQRRTPGVTYDERDVKGTGRAGTGPLFFTYHQLSSGPGGEWEWASAQAGQDRNVQFAERQAPSNPATPLGEKTVTLSITADGLVTETPLASFSPAAARYTPLTDGFMSADKSLIVGTATDTSGASPRYLLRIVQIVHLPLRLTTYGQADLAGVYTLHRLVVGPAPAWAFASQTFDTLGSGPFSTFLDSTDSRALPEPSRFAMDDSGSLTDTVDPAVHGKLSYFKSMFALTRTEGPGSYSLGIGLR